MLKLVTLYTVNKHDVIYQQDVNIFAVNSCRLRFKSEVSLIEKHDKKFVLFFEKQTI